MKARNICVVGAGRWGLNHIRTLIEINSLGGIVDTNVETLEFVKKNTLTFLHFQF